VAAASCGGGGQRPGRWPAVGAVASGGGGGQRGAAYLVFTRKRVFFVKTP